MSDSEPPVSGPRLRGGYLNSVVYRDGKVHKRYAGIDADARRNLEHETLLRLSHELNVPGAVISGSRTLVLEFADGTNGQELIRQGQPDLVLRACGEVLRRLQALDPGPLCDVLPGSGPTIVHGDFGPQNVLLCESAAVVTAILDWEFCHLGEPIEDLAWAEWIVRRHHRDAIAALPALFDGYESMPLWTVRKRSMVRTVEAMRSFAIANGHTADVRLWNERLNDLLTWDEEEFKDDGRAPE